MKLSLGNLLTVYKLTAKVRDENYSEIIDCVGVESNEQFAGGGDHFQLVALLP